MHPLLSWIQFLSRNINRFLDSPSSSPLFNSMKIDSFDFFLMSSAKVCVHVKIEEKERGNGGRRTSASKGARRARFAEEWKRKRERDIRKKGSWRHSTTISRHSSFYSFPSPSFFFLCYHRSLRQRYSLHVLSLRFLFLHGPRQWIIIDVKCYSKHIFRFAEEEILVLRFSKFSSGRF